MADTLTIEQEAMTADELKVYFVANPTEDVVLLEKRKATLLYKRVNEKYAFTDKTPVQIRTLLDERVSVDTVSMVDKKEVVKTIQVNKVGGLEARSLLSRVSRDKQQVIDEAVRLAEFEARYSVWVAIGKPVSMLEERDGVIGFDPSKEVS